MFGLPNWARGPACVLFFSCGCGPQGLAFEGDCLDLAPGDLVVTEVHANPDGRDGDREYIELYNTSEASISLAGLRVLTSQTDGSTPKSHRLVEGVVDASAYFVLGNALATPWPEHIDYSYGNALGSLRNSGALVSIWCGERAIDHASYGPTNDGRARELDGALAPNHQVNDDPNTWCSTPEGAGAFEDGGFGTPGRRNSPCAGMPLDGLCMDGVSARAPVPPRQEGVRITEWMANPEGPDADLEWIEITFSEQADLHGLQLGPSIEDLNVVIGRDACFPVDAGARMVFGASPAAAPRVDAELGFSLGNSGARTIVAAIGGVVLDDVDYEGTTAGLAWQVDGAASMCLADASNEYAPDNFGTPGAPNPTCPPVLETGMCLDDGVPRAIVSPGVGQARIVEWMADPIAVDNRMGEWVEVRFDAAVDLNGLTLADLTGPAGALESDECIAVAAGTHAVWARELDPSLNGGVGAVVAKLALSLNNRDETIVLSVDETMLDSVSYARAEPGTATQVDRLGDVCAASTPYGDGDLGTPGSPNPSCL